MTPNERLCFTGLPMKGGPVSDVFLLSERQMKRIEPFSPLARRVPRVDDRRVLSRIC